MFLPKTDNELTNLKGIGSQKKEALKKLGINSITDLLKHYPVKYQDRTKKCLLAAVAQNQITQASTFVVTTITVISHQYVGSTYKKFLKVIVKDESAVGSLLCFNRNFLAQTLPVGGHFHLAGFFTYKNSQISSSQFEVIKCGSENENNFFSIIPIYPLAKNISNNFLRSTIGQALTLYAHKLEVDIRSEILQEENLIPIAKAINGIHRPTSLQEKELAANTLKFVEFYQFHKNNILQKKARVSTKCVPLKMETNLQNSLSSSLPYKLTDSQLEVVNQINGDLCKDFPMQRLVQGDVGCGKTVVALMSALLVVANKKQVAFMAPTELLARQLATVISRLCKGLPIEIALLTGKLSTPKRKLLLEQLAVGNIDIVVGTHALFTNDVSFKELRLAIIDEQHKFGVNQRELLIQKGNNPHILLLSATPIPRTLAQSLYSHIDLSTIKTLPSGRKPIVTHLATEQNQHKVYQKVLAALSKNEQAYFVYPHIGLKDELEQSPNSILDLSLFGEAEAINANNPIKIKNATDAFNDLSTTHFQNYKCKLLHSQLSDEEKQLIMEQFYNHQIDILFATSVIEVGIDNPNATIMVIESAQQFGLSSLHQLRGRIGRGDKAATCFLIYNPNLSPQGKIRLRTMKESNDGFYISEVDLKLRGPGQIFGLKQWGDLKLNLANPTYDSQIEKRVLARIEKDIL